MTVAVSDAPVCGIHAGAAPPASPEERSYA